MDKEKLTDRLDKLNKDCNGIIGRLTMLRHQSDLAKECHTLILKLGSDIDDLINEIIDEPPEDGGGRCVHGRKDCDVCVQN